MENITNILKGSYSLIISLLGAISLWYLIFEVDFKIGIYIAGLLFGFFSKSIFTEIDAINNKLTKLENNSELTLEDFDYFYFENDRDSFKDDIKRDSFPDDVKRKADRSLLMNIWRQNERTQDMIADILELRKKRRGKT